MILPLTHYMRKTQAGPSQFMPVKYHMLQKPILKTSDLDLFFQCQYAISLPKDVALNKGLQLHLPYSCQQSMLGRSEAYRNISDPDLFFKVTRSIICSANDVTSLLKLLKCYNSLWPTDVFVFITLIFSSDILDGLLSLFDEI